jgi:hypothetical protein
MSDHQFIDEQEAERVRTSLTIAEIGVIVSLLCSVGSLIFTGGVIYGDVQRNTERLRIIEPKVDAISGRIERIDANVQFLTEQAQSRDRRGQ